MLSQNLVPIVMELQSSLYTALCAFAYEIYLKDGWVSCGDSNEFSSVSPVVLLVVHRILEGDVFLFGAQSRVGCFHLESQGKVLPGSLQR